MAQTNWREVVLSWYPDLHEKTYCIPPVYFNRVQYGKVTVAGQSAFLTQPQSEAGSTHSTTQFPGAPGTVPRGGHKASSTGRKRSKPSQSAASQKSSQATSTTPPCENPEPTFHSMWTKQVAGLPASKMPPVHPSDLRDDFAQQHVLHNLQALSEDQGQARFILSQLSFTGYLNKASYAAAAATHPRPVDLDPSYRRGDFDILVIDRQGGILVGEIKSIGLREKVLSRTQAESDADLMKRIDRALQQLDKSETVIKHLVSDLDPGLTVRKTLILPYVPVSQFRRVLESNPKLEEALRKCLGAPDADRAIQTCLLSDQMSESAAPWEVPRLVLDQLKAWWQPVMAATPHLHMSSDIYLDLIARFCGPATSVNVHFVIPPRVEVRTLWEAVSECAERLARLILTPEQLDLLNRAPDMVCLAGPPGTGKSLLLVMAGLVWLRQGHDVHVMSSNHASLVMSRLIYHQLQMTLNEDAMDSAEPVGSVRFHDFDFLNSPEDVEGAVTTLVAASGTDHPLCVLMDEIFLADRRMAPLYQQFVERLTASVHRLCLWVCTMRPVNIPVGLKLEPLTVPLRSAPVVVREVSKGVGKAGGLVPAYTSSGTPSPCDGPTVITLRHQGDGHVGRWPVECVMCGVDIAGVLKRLNVGVAGQGASNTSPPPLHFHDVFVLTRSSELHDDVIDDLGHVTSPVSGVVRGMRDAGIPVCVMGSVVTIDDESKWRENADDIAVAKCDRVIVGDYRAVVGLERKIVVYLPGRWQGVDDQRSEEAIDAMDRVFAMSRCTAQLIVVEVPNDAPATLRTGGTCSGEVSSTQKTDVPIDASTTDAGSPSPDDTGNVGSDAVCHDTSDDRSRTDEDVGDSAMNNVQKTQNARPPAGMWPIIFTKDDL